MPFAFIAEDNASGEQKQIHEAQNKYNNKYYKNHQLYNSKLSKNILKIRNHSEKKFGIYDEKGTIIEYQSVLFEPFFCVKILAGKFFKINFFRR